jgi:hypothetical protein
LIVVRVYSATAQEYLWDVYLVAGAQGMKELTLTYGVVPVGTKQRFPRTGPPRPLKAEEKIFIDMDFNYGSFFESLDSEIGVSSGWTLEIESGNTVKVEKKHPVITTPLPSEISAQKGT